MWLRKLNIKLVFFITIILGFIVRCSPEILIFGYNDILGLPGPFFAISDSYDFFIYSFMFINSLIIFICFSAVISVVSQISLMPLIVLGASVCPKGIEGSLYGFLMSLTEIGSIIGDLLGTSLTSSLTITLDNYDNLWLLILICNLCSLVPLCFLPLVPSTLNIQTEQPTEVELDELVAAEEDS